MTQIQPTDPTTALAVPTCPNAACEPGAILLGFKAPNGRIKNLRTAMAVDDAFVAQAREVGPPEQRMRFAAPCPTKDCNNWQDGGCATITRVLEQLENTMTDIAEILPPCPIRKTCQWYSQCGASACVACDIITNDHAPVQPGQGAT